MKILAYLMVLIGTVIGGFTFIESVFLAESAPQQAAGAAMAIAWAVLPYCFARAVEKMGEMPFSVALERQWRREQAESVVVMPKATTQPPMPTQTPKFHPLTGKALA